MFELETFRSLDTSNLKVVYTTDRDPWAYLIADPGYPGADLLQVYVEREQDSLGSGDHPEQGWKVIFQQTAEIGTREFVVVKVESNLLSPGVHRLRIESEKAGQTIGSTRMPFRVAQQESL